MRQDTVVDGLGSLADELAAAALALARRFAAGATLWCCSPGLDAHARHVAVEFVHPVVMGARALPAVAVAGGRPADELRALARTGDALVVVATPGDEPVVAQLFRRAEAWGLMTTWIGTGEPPTAGVADHVLRLEPDDDALAPYDGGLVLVYHLLWELTQVCFEHPGLLEPDAVDDEAAVCTTCADEGRVGEVVQADGLGAVVRTAAGPVTVDVTLVAPVRPGDLLLVHAGTALTVLDEAP